MRQILKQTSWLILAQVLTKVIGFFYTIFLAKSLGVSDFGLFTVALAYFSILSSIADFGFNRFLVRELAKDRLKTSELMCNVVMLRLTLTSLLFAVFAIFLYIFDADKMRLSLILLAVLAILPQSIALTFDSIFVATGKLQFSAAALLVSSLLTAVAGLFLVSVGFGAYGAVNASIFGQLVYVLVIVVLLYKISGLHLSNIKLSIIKEAIRESLPYGLLGVLGLLYFRIDVVLLSYIRGNYETGLYSAAYRFLEAIIFIPSAFAIALFPALSKLHDVAPFKLKSLYFKSIKLMLVPAVLIVLGYTTLLPQVIKVFLPNYLSSINAIKILSLAIPFIFIHIPGAQFLLSTDKYLKQVLLLSIFTLSFNVILNLIFIPQYGLLAASWVTVCSEILSFVVFFLLIQRILNKAN